LNRTAQKVSLDTVRTWKHGKIAGTGKLGDKSAETSNWDRIGGTSGWRGQLGQENCGRIAMSGKMQ
jgi:hypothetical protein